MTQELGPNQRAWLGALESGDWKQGFAVLCSKDDEYCCLGVGCIIANIKFEIDDDYLAPLALVEHLALFDENGSAGVESLPHKKTLAGLNDDGVSFPDIAALIRSDPSIYFREPR